MARAVTSDGDRIAALASAGTLYLPSYQKVILTRSRLRFDLVDLADRHTEDAHVVAGEDAVAVVEVGDDASSCGPVADECQTAATPANRLSTSTAASPILAL